MTSNSCRHFLGLFPDNRPACAKGRDVRAWAIRCNGGANHGIALRLRLPCTRQAEDAEKPLFDCPELDRRTDEEVAARDAEMRAVIGRLIAALPGLKEIKSDMIEKGVSEAIADCPFCGRNASLRVSVATGVNNHMRAVCDDCGEGFIE